MNKRKNIPFRFSKIETKEFATLEDNFDESIEEITIETEPEFGFDASSKAISFYFKVTLLQKAKPFMILKAGGIFEIKPKAWDEEIEKEGKYIFPKGLLQHLLTLVVGTCRGIMHTKIADQTFKDFVLPTINVTEMITEDFVIDQE